MKQFTGLILVAVMALMSCGNPKDTTQSTPLQVPPLQMKPYAAPANVKNVKITQVVFLYFDTVSKDSTFKWAQGFLVQGDTEQLVRSKTDSTKFEKKLQPGIVDVLDKYQRRIPQTWYVWDNRVVQGQQ